MSALYRQRGVAIITALVVVAAATIAVAGMLWHQSVAVRKLENQNALAQARWLGRSAVEWSRLILLQDARTSAVDHEGELWAVPLAETRVTDTPGHASGTVNTTSTAINDDADAVVNGRIVDIQSRFNLANLVLSANPQASAASSSMPLPLPGQQQGQPPSAPPNPASGSQQTREQGPDDGINKSAVSALKRLLEMVGQPEEIAAVFARRIVQLPRPLDFDQLAAELLQAHLVDPAIIEALRPYVVLLPEPTPVNFNTASPEVMAAVLPGLSLAQARLLAASRDRIYFNQVPDIFSRLATVNATVDAAATNRSADIAVASHYFEVNGQVHYGRAEYRLNALIERKNGGQTQVLSLKEQ